MEPSCFADGDAAGGEWMNGTRRCKRPSTAGGSRPQGITKAIGMQFEKATDAIYRAGLGAAEALDGGNAVAGATAAS